MSLAGQNLVQHYPGTSNFSSRGSATTGQVTLLQRLPDDQIRGRTAVHSLTCVVQSDSTAAGVATWTVEVRKNDPTVSTGAPDMSPAGLVGAIPVSLPVPAGTFAFQVTTTPATPIRLPATTGVPAGDIYVGLALPAPTPAGSLGMHMALDTSARPNAIGYTGAPGVVGLGWEAPGGVAPRLFLPNQGLAWNIATFLVDETLQPFLMGASFPQPHFGYGALFPDVAGRGDRFGLRTVAQGGALDVSVLIVGMATPAPIPVPGLGNLCLLPVVPVAASLFQPFGRPGSVAATFGPYAGFVGPGDLHLQALSYKFGGGHRLSTSCKIDF